MSDGLRPMPRPLTSFVIEAQSLNVERETAWKLWHSVVTKATRSIFRAEWKAVADAVAEANEVTNGYDR